jgi:DNA-binding response OmpR family regulator
MPKTILVVDDNVSSVTDLVHAFAASGLTAVGAHSFADALKVLGSVEPELMTTGVRLCPFNGLHLVLRVRALYPGTAAIVIGPDDPMLASDARALGADAYLTTLSPGEIVLEALKILGRPRDGANSLHMRGLPVAAAAASPLADAPALS